MKCLVGCLRSLNSLNRGRRWNRLKSYMFQSRKVRCRATLRRLFSLLLALVVWATGVVVGQTIPVPPVEFPFDASSASSSIDATVRIVSRRSYYFDLQFHYSGQNDMPKVRELVGGGARFADGRYAEPGIIVPVHLEVVEILGGDRTRTVYDKTNETQGRYAHNLDGSYARVIAGIILTPGLYKVRASTTQETSVLSGINARFAITYDARFPPIKE